MQQDRCVTCPAALRSSRSRRATDGRLPCAQLPPSPARASGSDSSGLTPSAAPDNLAERLTAADQEKVTLGNLCAQAALKFIRACDVRGIPWIVENPQSSKLWCLPEFEQLASAAHTQVRVIDFCAYGMPWRKRTRLLLGNVDSCDLERLSFRKCSGVSGGCSFRPHKHFHLTGTGPGGVPWTSLAQPYPSLLCKDLAHILCASDIVGGLHLR